MHSYGKINLFIYFILIWNGITADIGSSILFAPRFLEYDDTLEPVIRPAGQSTVLKCSAEGNPPPEIYWLKDGAQIKICENKRKWRWDLKLEHLAVSDGGIYTCIASNSLGSINFNITLEVPEKLPHEATVPDSSSSDRTVHVGGNFTLSCNSEAHLYSSVKWIKFYQVNGSWLDENKAPYMKEVWSANSKYTNPRFLILENAAYEDSGKYFCLEFNVCDLFQNSAQVKVLPQNLHHVSNMVGDFSSDEIEHEGTDVEFDCSTDEVLFPSAKWLKFYQVNGSWTDESNVPYMQNVQSINSEHSNPTSLILENVTYEDDGKYACLSFNALESLQKSVSITVLPQPDPVYNTEKYIIIFSIIAAGIVIMLLIVLIYRRYKMKKKKQIAFKSNQFM